MSLNQIELKRIKRTGLIAPIILLAIGTLHLKKGHLGLALFLYILATVIFFMTMFLPSVFKRTTNAIGELITKLLLSVVFYIAITPLGLIMRLFGKDMLKKRIEKDRDSYWIKKESAAEPISSYEKQF